MMNYLWGGMILLGIAYGAVTGRMQEVTDAALASSREAVSLCITMVGVMSLWMGVMEVAREAGLIQAMSRWIRPVIRFLFPYIPEKHPANEHIATNFIANFLGLGWAATPAGLKAMESLSELEEERREYELTGKTPGKYPDREKREEEPDYQGLETCGIPQPPAVPRGTASREMCTFLIMNISSLQLIPVSIIAYRSQYGSVNPTAVVGPAIVATAVSTVAAVGFCKVMDRKRRA